MSEMFPNCRSDVVCDACVTHLLDRLRGKVTVDDAHAALDKFCEALLADLTGPTVPDVPADPPGGEHKYLSTGCMHGEHGYCQSMTGFAGVKRPGKCKFCDAQCRCECHTVRSEASAGGES